MSVGPSTVSSRERTAWFGFTVAVVATIAAGSGPAAARSSSSCDDAQEATIRIAFAAAQERIKAALAFLASAPGHAHVRAWFGNAPPWIVRAQLEATLRRLRPGNRPSWKCASAQACEGDRLFAVAWLDRGSIGLCRLFFHSSPEKGADSRRGVIVHEVSHIAAVTQDLAYGVSGARALARKHPEAAARNADNVEYFVEFLPKAPPARHPIGLAVVKRAARR